MGALVSLARSGPAGWKRLYRTIASSEWSGLSNLARHVALAMFGAELAYLARRRGWRHVQVHSCADSANIALYAHAIARLPYSVTLHGPLRDYGPNQPMKWRFAAFAFVITRKLLGEVQEALASNLPPSVDVVPMGVDVELFKRRTAYRPWRGEGPGRVFTCGRLHPCKGHHVLIRACAALRQRGLPVELHIAGADDSATGEYRRFLEQLVDVLEAKGYVRLLGAVSEASVRDELEAAHVFALASHHEPLGVVIMEAMAMQVPVVATSAGGVCELVDAGRDGVLVPPGSPDALAEAIETILRDPSLADRFSAAGRGKIESSFHSRRSAGALARRLGVAVPAAVQAVTAAGP